MRFPVRMVIIGMIIMWVAGLCSYVLLPKTKLIFRQLMLLQYIADTYVRSLLESLLRKSS